jgi:hypothetical protein
VNIAIQLLAEAPGDNGYQLSKEVLDYMEEV